MGERTGKAKQAGQDRGKDEAADRPERGRRFGRPHQEILMGAVMLAVFIYMRIQLDGLVQGRRGAAYLDPDFWPGWLLNILILLVLIYLVQSIVRAVRSPQVAVTAQTLAEDGEPAAVADEPTADADGEAPAPAPAQPQEEGPSEDDATSASTARKNLVALMTGFALIFALIFLMPRLGFVPSAVLFAVAFLLTVGERRWYIIALVPTGLLALILYVFTRLLVVPLPRGQGVFLEFSTFFY